MRIRGMERGVRGHDWPPLRMAVGDGLFVPMGECTVRSLLGQAERLDFVWLSQWPRKGGIFMTGSSGARAGRVVILAAPASAAGSAAEGWKPKGFFW